MKDTLPEGADRTGSLAKKILGKNPRVSAMMILAIVLFCFVFSFSKETMRNYEAALRRGLGMEAEGGCPAGWVSYRHEVIGIGFCYPAEWGNVKTEPKEPVTRLADLLEDYANGDNGYRDSFFILFDNNPDVRMRVFNENYAGERYAGDPAGTSFVDNIGTLKATAAVCNYEKNYGYKGDCDVRIKETYAECGNGIKTAINDTQETSNERIDTSVLESFAYAKLVNGYFDHAFAEYVYGNAIQPGKEYGGIDEILPDLGIGKEEFGRKEDDFTAFVKSIEAFVPGEKAPAEFKMVPGEDPRITLIRRYYHLIRSGNLEEAYALKSDQGSFEDFVSFYEDAYIAEPHNFEDKGENRFSFLMKYQDHNEREREYRVRMEAAEGEIRTISVEESTDEQVFAGEYSASVTERSEKEYVILRKGEEETIVDEGSNYSAEAKASGFGESFSDVAFSPDGRYLMYSSSDYEYLASSIYDIAEKKIVMEVPGTEVGNSFGFTPDGRYFYLCASPGIYEGDAGKAFSVPGFEQVFDAKKDGGKSYLTNMCAYDAQRNAIIFTASDPVDESIAKSREAVFGLEK